MGEHDSSSQSWHQISKEWAIESLSEHAGRLKKDPETFVPYQFEDDGSAVSSSKNHHCEDLLFDHLLDEAHSYQAQWAIWLFAPMQQQTCMEAPAKSLTIRPVECRPLCIFSQASIYIIFWIGLLLILSDCSRTDLWCRWVGRCLRVQPWS